ncbi:restriction endonuclease subunit S [Bradyrhizobium sp. 956_D2_N1_5]|uniref:restriction endonuclease subunit S n=1 Tax=unclassified Bradyrhizobium TaxID=2631580 RepID=UPI003F2794ED
MSLPTGWVRLQFQEITPPEAPIIYGILQPGPQYEGGVLYVRPTEISDGKIQLAEVRRTSPQINKQYTRSILRVNDLILSIVGTIGKVAATPPELEGGNITQSSCRIRVDTSLFQFRFVQYFLRSKAATNQFGAKRLGTAVPRLNIADVRRLEIALPPLAEQRRIVEKLDALTARIVRARAEISRANSLAADIRLSALRSVFQFDAKTMPAGWSQKRIDQIADVQLGRQRSPKDHSGPNMRPYLRAANITWNGWDLSDVKEMNFSPAEFQTFRLRPGDVLLNEGSGSAKEVGKPAVWRGEIANACFQNTLLRIRPKKYNPDLLRYCLLYLALSGQFVANTKGVNIIHIGKAGLVKFIVPEPPESQQSELLARLSKAFARADRLETETARARALVDRLESAILAKAFRGELVAQDPNDEPASALLDRIRAGRAAAPRPNRRRIVNA